MLPPELSKFCLNKHMPTYVECIPLLIFFFPSRKHKNNQTRIYTNRARALPNVGCAYTFQKKPKTQVNEKK